MASWGTSKRKMKEKNKTGVISRGPGKAGGKPILNKEGSQRPVRNI